MEFLSKLMDCEGGHVIEVLNALKQGWTVSVFVKWCHHRPRVQGIWPESPEGDELREPR